VAKIWDELADGTLKLTVSPDEGGSASVFYGQTRDEILDKLCDSQANANRRIDQLRVTSPTNGNGTGHAAAPPVNLPKPLTANDRMQAVADLANPANVDKAVTRVMESVIGPIDQFQQDREAERAKRTEEAAVSAAEEFSSLTPEFFLSDFNVNTMFRYLQSMQYDPTKVASYQRAFAELTAGKLLQSKAAPVPNDDEPPTEPQERNAPTLSAPRAPARYSTGVRQSDISGTAPVPVKRLKWSREQIANMGAQEMRRLVADPEFNFCVEYYARNSKRKAAAAAV
jgi:hypothetical protein